MAIIYESWIETEESEIVAFLCFAVNPKPLCRMLLFGIARVDSIGLVSVNLCVLAVAGEREGGGPLSRCRFEKT